jgi:hypothetical protein
MDFGRYKISMIIVLVVLIIAVFIWKRRGEKMNGKKGKKTKILKKSTKKISHPEKVSNNDSDNDSDNDDNNEKQPQRTASGNIADDAKELFDLVHNNMASGMQIDAFEDAAGDLAGDDPSEIFVNLKQKYTQAIDDNRDPMRSVTVKDYIQILQKS